MFGEVRELAQEHGPTAVGILARIMADETSKPVERIRAAEVLLDRGYGRPMQTLEHADVTPGGLEGKPVSLLELVKGLKSSALGAALVEHIMEENPFLKGAESENSAENTLGADNLLTLPSGPAGH